MSANTSASVLGRGLGSLLPTPGRAGRTEGKPLFVRVGAIRPLGDQPRQHFDDRRLRQLAVSIREQGILQPLVVTPGETPNTYTLIAGERRLRASVLAGLSEVPVVLRAASAREAFELALIENIQREDLNPIEEAEAFRRLIDEHGFTQEVLARRVGKDRTTVTNSLRLLKLSGELRERLLHGSMTAGHARALLGCDDPAMQDELARRIEAEGLSVRAIERLVAAYRDRKLTGRRPDPRRAERRALTNRLQSTLGRSVRIRTKAQGKGGSLTIDYNSETDLRALVAQLAARVSA